MNIQEYTSTGIIEAYVLALTSDDERSEFEAQSMLYPELKKAKEDFELSLEKAALQNAATPDRSLKSKIFAEIEIEAYDQQTALDSAELQAPVIEMHTDQVASIGFRRYLNIAAVILLAGSIAMNLYFFSQYRSYSSRYNELLATQSNIAATNKTLQTKLNQYEQNMSMIKDPDMLLVKMPAANVQTSPDPGSMAMVYYNTRSNQVYLVVNHLPQPAPDKQYQLWAIIDGKPVDAGVFTPGKESMLPMKNVRGAQAFAITLEKPGGSVAPEGPMYVLGKVS